ncbi:MAG: TetR/AcrR family transcriptional regulator [Actinomycetota bacterium]|nr:TetR/AcrR family transcriptional regulator [Actinomycetota bacterium]
MSTVGADGRTNGRAPRRRGRNSARRRDVVDVACRLFAERGYHGTSMRDLGNELGLLGSSVYAHIGSKDELLIELIREGAEHFCGLADAVLDDGAAPDDQLRALVRGHVAIVADHRDRVAVYLHEHRFLPEPHRSEAGALRDRYEAAYRAVLRRGANDGSFRADLDVDLDSRFILSTLNALDRWYDPDGPLDVDALAAALDRFVARGIGAPAPAAVTGAGSTREGSPAR